MVAHLDTDVDLLLVKCTESNLFFKRLFACYLSLVKQFNIWVNYELKSVEEKCHNDQGIP